MTQVFITNQKFALQIFTVSSLYHFVRISAVENIGNFNSYRILAYFFLEKKNLIFLLINVPNFIHLFQMTILILTKYRISQIR